jgi:fructokinase
MLVVAGEALMDMVPAAGPPGTHFQARPGGSPYNVAIGCARLGMETAFLGRFSTDPFGRRLMAHLSDNGVHDDLLIDGDEPTSLAFALPDEEGVASYVFYMENTAELALRPSHVPASLSPDALHIGSIALVAEPIAGTLDRLVERLTDRSTISLDPNVRPQFIPDREVYRERLDRQIARAHLVKVSDEDLAWLEPGRDPLAVARGWRNLGPRLVVVTYGREGAVAVGDGTAVAVPGAHVEVVDTVGAGDSFMSALLAWLDAQDMLTSLRRAAPDRESLREMLRWATHAAALTCSRTGADPPAVDELTTWMATDPGPARADG